MICLIDVKKIKPGTFQPCETFDEESKVGGSEGMVRKDRKPFEGWNEAIDEGVLVRILEKEKGEMGRDSDAGVMKYV